MKGLLVEAEFVLGMKSAASGLSFLMGAMMRITRGVMRSSQYWR